MAVLFIPVPQNFAAATVAGSGNVIRWTYTVPVGKRAILEHTSILILVSAAAANTTIAYVQANIGGTLITVLRAGNAAVITGEINASLQPHIDLRAGDTVQGGTINNAAVNVTMAVYAVIREYQ